MNFFDFFKPKYKATQPRKFSGEGAVLIAQITNLSAQMFSPEQFVDFLKKHIETQKTIVSKHGGMIQVFASDAILAYWTGAKMNNDYANGAFLAAKELLSAVSNDVDYRVSLSTGALSGDFFGSIKQFEIVGKAVTEADQLSRFTHLAHRVILVTESTKSKITLGNPSYRSLGELPNHSQVFACNSGEVVAIAGCI